MTQETSRTLVRWKNWLDYRSVGIYSHDESPTWKRPHQNCEMRYLNSQFCPVCQEAIANKILNLTNPIIEYSPAEDGFILDEPEIEFSVNLLKPNPNTMHLVWTLNGEPRANNVENLRFESSTFAAGENTVSVYILDTTKFIRSSDHNTKHLHQIHWTFNSGTSGIHLDEVQTNKFNIDIYPNPAHSFIKISGEMQNPAKVGMDLLTIDGRQIRFIEVSERPAGPFAEEFDIQKLSLSSGLYHVLISVDGQIVSIPLVIN